MDNHTRAVLYNLFSDANLFSSVHDFIWLVRVYFFVFLVETLECGKVSNSGISLFGCDIRYKNSRFACWVTVGVKCCHQRSPKEGVLPSCHNVGCYTPADSSTTVATACCWLLRQTTGNVCSTYCDTGQDSVLTCDVWLALEHELGRSYRGIRATGTVLLSLLPWGSINSGS